MKTPTINVMALQAALDEPGRCRHQAAFDLPPWVKASMQYDIDHVLMLEVHTDRLDKGPLVTMQTLADQLSELGWKQQAWGPCERTRHDGVNVAFCWSTWVKGAHHVG